MMKFKTIHSDWDLLKRLRFIVLALILLSWLFIICQNYHLLFYDNLAPDRLRFIHITKDANRQLLYGNKNGVNCAKFDIQPSAMMKANSSESELTAVKNKFRILKEPIDLKQHLLFNSELSAQSCLTPVFALLIINSHVRHYNRRIAIRKTWGSSDVDETIRDQITSDYVWKTLFILGIDSNASQLEVIRDESMIYKDIIVANVVESHQNLTEKTALGMYWTEKYCKPKYYIKSDDDVWINKQRMLQYLRKLDQDISVKNDKLWLGHVGRNNRIPVRDPKNKYYTTYEDYPGNLFPSYCSGFAYVISGAALQEMVQAMKCIPRLPGIDDVYVGILAKAINIRPKDCIQFHMQFAAFAKNHFNISEIDKTLAKHGIVAPAMHLALTKLAQIAFNRKNSIL